MVIHPPTQSIRTHTTKIRKKPYYNPPKQPKKAKKPHTRVWEREEKVVLRVGGSERWMNKEGWKAGKEE